MKPGEHALQPFAADRTPRMILFAEFRGIDRGRDFAFPCSILNTPALRVVIAEAGVVLPA